MEYRASSFWRAYARAQRWDQTVYSVGAPGYWGYYLPDQDHGAEHSEFVDFFATYKATLPAIGRLMKVCRARVVPLFPVYDSKTHRLTVLVRPPMDDLLDADDTTIARRMNEEVEVFVKPHTEQYTDPEAAENAQAG